METIKIGDKIAKARKDKNFSQAQLAEQLFISPQAVGKWERGESLPDLVMFNRLAATLGVDLNYFSDSFESVAVKVSEKPKLNWDMSRGNWLDADFSGLKGLHEKFSSSNMQRCKFKGSVLAGLLLKSNYVNECDFSTSDLSGSRVQTSHFVNDLFNDCSLRGAEFVESHLKTCDFSGADFTGATFKSSGFEKSQVSGAVWNRTVFNGAHLAHIEFNGTVTDCSFENCGYTKVTFQRVRLVNTFFKGGKLKSIRFVDCQADRLTYEFLKNGKADLGGISLMD